MNSRIDSLDLLLDDLKKIPLLSKEEEMSLAVLAQAGDLEARNKLINANLRFVFSIAKKYQNRGLDLADLFQEGLEGMIVASDKFDPSKGIKFISYAVWWIRQRILVAIYNARVVREPTNIASLRSKIHKFRNSHYTKFGCYPSSIDVGKHFSISEEQADYFLGGVVVSFDAPLSTDAGHEKTLHHTLRSERLGHDEELSDRDEFEWKRETVLRILSTMNASPRHLRNKQIFLERYGFDGSESTPSLEELGAKYEMTRERARQIVEAIEKYIVKQLKRRGLYNSSSGNELL